MKKSEFLKRLSEGAYRLVVEYNDRKTDKKTFNWQAQSVYYTKVANLFYSMRNDDLDDNNPVAVAIRYVAHRRPVGSLDLDTLVAMEEAWEYFEEKAREAALTEHLNSVP